MANESPGSKYGFFTRTKEYNDAQSLAMAKKHPEYYLFNNAKQRAKKTNRNFSINISDIQIPKYCPILGIELSEVRSRNYAAPSVDRIDNSKDYIKGNIAVISRQANSRKGDMSKEDIKRLYEYSLSSET